MDEVALRVLKVTAKYDECDSVWWRTDGEYSPVTFLCNCNDLFWWACSDAEAITKDNIEIFEQCFVDCAKADSCGECYANLLFCCRARGMRPQGAFYRLIPNKLWDLFDESGPFRKTDIGNPEPHPRS